MHVTAHVHTCKEGEYVSQRMYTQGGKRMSQHMYTHASLTVDTVTLQMTSDKIVSCARCSVDNRCIHTPCCTVTHTHTHSLLYRGAAGLSTEQQHQMRAVLTSEAS